MTILHKPIAGGNKITIATWFKVLNPIDLTKGCGISPPEWRGAGPPPPYLNSNGAVSLFEWGYDQRSDGFPPGDELVQCASHVYALASGAIGIGIFGPFYPLIGEFPFRQIEGNWAGDWNYASQTLTTVVGWGLGQWNQLLVSYDGSVADSWSSNCPFNGLPQTLTQGSKIWAVVNGGFDTATTYTHFFPGGPGCPDPTFVPSLPNGLGGQYGSYDNLLDTGGGSFAANFGPTVPCAFMAGDFGMPCLSLQEGNDSYNYQDLAFGAATQVWVGTYVDPSPANFAKFYRTDPDTGLIFPIDAGQAAAAEFGEPDIWLLRDNVSGVLFNDQNLGSAGNLNEIGTIKDFGPGPEIEGAAP